ncbi:MAG TPA: hypothetical protein VMN35_06985 [Gaiellaceae bacterium]|nr:hypothetical protein [Gaiellaceae bacterium]
MDRIKLTCVLGGIVVALAGCGSGDDEAAPPTTTQTTVTQTTTETETETTPTPPVPTTIRIRVRDGRPLDGIARPSVRQGERVVLVVSSNVSDHVHVHGCDLFADVAPGRNARIAFRATIPGRFEIELEDRHVQIAELTVRP